MGEEKLARLLSRVPPGATREDGGGRRPARVQVCLRMSRKSEGAGEGAATRGPIACFYAFFFVMYLCVVCVCSILSSRCLVGFGCVSCRRWVVCACVWFMVLSWYVILRACACVRIRVCVCACPTTLATCLIVLFVLFVCETLSTVDTVESQPNFDGSFLCHDLGSCLAKWGTLGYRVRQSKAQRIAVGGKTWTGWR